MNKRLSGWVVAAFLSGVGCGGTAGDAATGKTLFESRPTIDAAGRATGCTTCHSVQEGVKGTGPSLAGIGTDALDEYKAAGKSSAHAWIRDNITDPNSDIVEGFSPNIMPGSYGTTLTATQLDDIAAYLTTLK